MLATVARGVLKVMPTSLAFPMTTLLAALPQRAPLKPRDRQALERAQRLSWGASGRHVAWAWGAGPAVVLVHGWHGRAVQMAPLAEWIAQFGFRCVAPDLSAHGDSPGRRISFDRFVSDLADFTAGLAEPLHSLVGHSAGGLTMMTARVSAGVTARNYVCINAPRAPYPPIASIRETLAPGAAVLERCRAYYADQFPFDAARLDAGEAYRYHGRGRLMLVYDYDDPRVDIDDADVVARQWPNAEIFRTRGFGHQNTLWSEEIVSAVAEFICRDVAPGTLDRVNHATEQAWL